MFQGKTFEQIVSEHVIFIFLIFFSCFCTTLSALTYSFPSGNTFALKIRSSVYLVPAAYCFHGVLFDLTINRKITDILELNQEEIKYKELINSDGFFH